MELRQLRYFDKTCELLNFTEAAKELFISQSTLSQQIKQLEEELGVLLFDRIGKRIILTEAGRLFWPYAKKALYDADSGKQIIQDLRGMEIGSLHIGVTYSLSALLTKALENFSKRFPKIRVNITFQTSEELINQLETNKMDFILSFRSGKISEEYEMMPLFSSRLHLVVHESHPIAHQKMTLIEKLTDLPMILPAKGFATREIIDRICEQKGLKLAVALELNDVPTIIQLVKTGNWATILTFSAVKNENSFVKIPIRSEVDLSTHASLFWTKGTYRKQSALAFADILLKMTGAR